MSCCSGLVSWIRRRGISARTPFRPPAHIKRIQGCIRRFCRFKQTRKKIGLPSAADSDDGPSFWDMDIREECDGNGLPEKVEICYELDLLDVQVTAVSSLSIEKFPAGKMEIFKEDDKKSTCSFSSGSSSMRNDPISYMKKLGKVKTENESEWLSKGMEKLPEIGPDGLDVMPPEGVDFVQKNLEPYGRRIRWPWDIEECGKLERVGCPGDKSSLSIKKFPEGKMEICKEYDKKSTCSFSSGSSSMRSDPIAYMKNLARIETEDDCEWFSNGMENLPEIGPDGMDVVLPENIPSPSPSIWSNVSIFLSGEIQKVNEWIDVHECTWLSVEANEFGGIPYVLRREPKPDGLEAAGMKPRVVSGRMVSAETFVIKQDKLRTQSRETEESMEMGRKNHFDDMLAPTLDYQALTSAWLKMTYPDMDEKEIKNEDEEYERILDEVSNGSGTGDTGGISTSPTSLTSQDRRSLAALKRELNIPMDDYGPSIRVSRMGTNAFPWTNIYMESDNTVLVEVGPTLGQDPQLSNLDSCGPVYRLIGMNKKNGILRDFNIMAGDIKSRFNWKSCLSKMEFLYDPDPEV